MSEVDSFRGSAIDTSIFNYLENPSDYALGIVPLIAFAEACIGIGLFVSGLILFGVCIALYNAEILTLWQIAPLAFIGAVIGDHTGYFVGSHYGPRIHEFSLAQRYQQQLRKAESLILRFGASAILIGRFIPAIRSILPALLGVSGFPRARYHWLDTLACALWAALLALLVWLSVALL